MGGTRKLLAKEKKGLFQSRAPFFGGSVGGACQADYLSSVDQKIPD